RRRRPTAPSNREAERRDEKSAALVEHGHSITWSARARSDGGIADSEYIRGFWSRLLRNSAARSERATRPRSAGLATDDDAVIAERRGHFDIREPGSLKHCGELPPGVLPARLIPQQHIDIHRRRGDRSGLSVVVQHLVKD